MAGGEGLVLSLRGEEGLHGVHGGGHVGRVFQQVQDLLKGAGLARLGAQGGADGGKAVPILGEDGVVAVQVEGVHEPLPQALEEVEGPPRKTMVPFSSRPWVRPATVWSTTAWKMEAATSSFRPPWLRMGWMSLLANTPHREAMG